MRPAEDIENAVKHMSFAAGPDMDKRLWKGMAQRQHEAQTTIEIRGNTRVWRILMNSKITRMALAAVVVGAALAVGVERLTRTEPEKTYAFSAEIQADMALDLDPKGAIPLQQPEPGDFDITWDGENGGTLRIMPGSSLRLCTPSKRQPRPDQALLWAHSMLAEMPDSTTTSVSASQSRFAAILTSEGNLAVIQIGEYDENKAQLQWQVEDATLPGYGPAQVVTLAHADSENPTAQACAIDFDTGQTSVIPANVMKATPEALLDWLQRHGIDAIAQVTDDGGALVGTGLAVKDLGPHSWVVARALLVRHATAGVMYESRDPVFCQQGSSQRVHAFKTREGSIGILQMQNADPSQQTVQFRYRTVQEGYPEEVELPPIYQSGDYLADLGRDVLIYAGEHEDRFPQSLEEMRDRVDDEAYYQWMIRDVAYLGARVTTDDPFSLVIAYDRALLALGKGTNVLFLDSHIEFLEPKELEKLGLPTSPEESELGRIHQAAKYLCDLGRDVLIYANDHEDRFPQSLEEMRDRVDDEAYYQWMVQDVAYLGAGVTIDDPLSKVIAYDRALLALGKGTNVLFLDSHIELVEPEELEKLGLPTSLEEAVASRK